MNRFEMERRILANLAKNIVCERDEAEKMVVDPTQGQWIGFVQSRMHNKSMYGKLQRIVPIDYNQKAETFPQAWDEIAADLIALVMVDRFKVSKKIDSQKMCEILPVAAQLERVKDLEYKNPVVSCTVENEDGELVYAFSNTGVALGTDDGILFEGQDIKPIPEVQLLTKIAGVAEGTGLVAPLKSVEAKTPGYSAGAPNGAWQMNAGYALGGDKTHTPLQVISLLNAPKVLASKMVTLPGLKLVPTKPKLDKLPFKGMDPLLRAPKRFQGILNQMDIPHRTWNDAVAYTFIEKFLKCSGNFKAVKEVSFFGMGKFHGVPIVRRICEKKVLKVFDSVAPVAPVQSKRILPAVFEVLSRDYCEVEIQNINSFVKYDLNTYKGYVMSNVWHKKFKDNGIFDSLKMLLNSEISAMVKFNGPPSAMAALAMVKGTVLNIGRPAKYEFYITNELGVGIKDDAGQVLSYAFSSANEFSHVIRQCVSQKLGWVSVFRNNFEIGLKDPWRHAGRMIRVDGFDLPILFQNAKHVKPIALSDLTLLYEDIVMPEYEELDDEQERNASGDDNDELPALGTQVEAEEEEEEVIDNDPPISIDLFG